MDSQREFSVYTGNVLMRFSVLCFKVCCANIDLTRETFCEARCPVCLGNCVMLSVNLIAEDE